MDGVANQQSLLGFQFFVMLFQVVPLLQRSVAFAAVQFVDSWHL